MSDVLNKSCPHYPCHVGMTSCLFCYCPMYTWEHCYGEPSWTTKGTKDCSRCLWPHQNGAEKRMLGELKREVKSSLGIKVHKLYEIKCHVCDTTYKVIAENIGCAAHKCMDKVAHGKFRCRGCGNIYDV